MPTILFRTIRIRLALGTLCPQYYNTCPGSQNFSYTENASSDSHNAEHARNLNTQPQQQTQQPLRRHQQTQDKDPFANVSFSANENNDVTFDNDYLDENWSSGNGVPLAALVMCVWTASS